jgi:tRNA pseudouridine13 synthase
LRVRPEDFQVEEELGFEPDGDGDHLLLRVRKTGTNTEWVARQLAQCAGVPVSSVGYAGLKDRQAVALQWFSLPCPPGDPPDWTPLPAEGIVVLRCDRHRRKLRRGVLRANRFEIRVRDLGGATLPGLAQRLESVRARGVPNYFGEQRFGHQESNLAHASALFAGQTRPRSRHLSGLWLSAARAQIFNEVLAARVARGDWDKPRPGDAMQLSGSRSYFVVERLDDALVARCAEMDIHPTGPLWGRGDRPTRVEVGALEAACADAFPQWCAGLADAGLKQERRALRLPVPDLAADQEDDGLRLRFTLPAGSYATVVLREILETAGGANEASHR